MRHHKRLSILVGVGLVFLTILVRIFTAGDTFGFVASTPVISFIIQVILTLVVCALIVAGEMHMEKLTFLL